VMFILMRHGVARLPRAAGWLVGVSVLISISLAIVFVPGDVATEAFGEIGWGWGGNWNSLKDWMHFSYTGR